MLPTPPMFVEYGLKLRLKSPDFPDQTTSVGDPPPAAALPDAEQPPAARARAASPAAASLLVTAMTHAPSPLRTDEDDYDG
jgi:hypothetical protein